MHRPIGRRVHDYPQQRKQAETLSGFILSTNHPF